MIEGKIVSGAERIPYPCTGPLLVIGGARCVWDDLERFGDGTFRGHRMAVNDVGLHYDRKLAHWATVHAEWFKGWVRYRMAHNYADGKPVTHCYSEAEGVDVIWSHSGNAATSGFFATLCGLFLGYAPVILAGVPIDDSGHYFDPPWKKSKDIGTRPMRRVWEQAAAETFNGRVKSLSGFTRDLLGAP